MDNPKAGLIRALNDLLRVKGKGGRTVITPGIDCLGPLFLARVWRALRAYRAFGDDNDPYEEHDFGALRVDGVKILWKIDYYDLTFSAGADDPSDPASCGRVLTVMLAEEY
jgi:hypothetical protein